MLRGRVSAIVFGATMILALFGPASASAGFDIVEWDGHFVTSEPDILKAGSHPEEIVNTLNLSTHPLPSPDGAIKGTPPRGTLSPNFLLDLLVPRPR